MRSPERAAQGREISDSADSDSVLLGDGPPWIVAFCVSVIAALIGSLIVAVFLFSEPNETVTIVVDGGSAAPEPIIAPAGGTITAKAIDDGARVAKGDLLLVISAGAAGGAQATGSDRIISPVDGVVSFAKPLTRGAVVTEFEHIADVDRTDTLLLSAYVDAREIQRVKPGQLVLVSAPHGISTKRIRARIVRIALSPSGGRYMLTLSSERPVYAGVRTIDSQRNLPAFIVVRHRSFLERSFALVKGLL